MAASTNKEVAKELLPLIRVYKDGSVERMMDSPYVPPTLDPDPQFGVSSKDVTISRNPAISARLYLPKLAQPHQKLPVLVYFHGSAFCFESAFSFIDHRYLNILVSQSQVLAVSIEYRLAPEHLLPAAYEDCWTAFQWVASHRNRNSINHHDHDHQNHSNVINNKEPWLLNHGDFERLFIGGDSAGGNIVHNIAMKAGEDDQESLLKEGTGVRILGAFLVHPFFWGSGPVGSESDVSDNYDHKKRLEYLIWEFVYPTAPGGIDNPMINPVGSGKPSLAKLACSRMLVCVAGKDSLRDRGVLYVNAVKGSGFGGEVEFFEVKGEDHVFHITNPDSENAKKMFNRLASFLTK